MFSSWEACHAQVNGYKGACYRRYKCKTDACDAFLSYENKFSMVDTKKCWSWKDVVILVQFLVIFLLILIICIT